MIKIVTRAFGQVIRERRRQLDLTQEEVAHRIKTSVPYFAYLESAKRHPSEKVVVRLAEALGLDPRELFLLANPRIRVLLSQHPRSEGTSAWDSFAKDQTLLKLHNVTDEEMQTLSQVAMMGEVRSSRDFLFILNTIRQSLCR
jgi:transcriptional regulator with XRE-family HTH domain